MVSIQVNSAIIGAVIGGLLTLLGTAFIKWYRHRNRKVRLRRRLGMEMNMMVRDLEFLFLIFWNLSADVEPTAFYNSFYLFDEDNGIIGEDLEETKEMLSRFLEESSLHFRTDVYDSSQKEIGMLKSEQILYIGTFYQQIRLVDDVLESRFGNVEELDNSEVVEETYDSNICEAIEQAIDARKRALDAIGIETITIYDHPYAVYEKKSEDWSLYRKIIYWFGGYR